MRLTLLIAAMLGATVSAADAPAAEPSAYREWMIETSATVEAVDLPTREVRLRAPDGRVLTVVASPEVANLSELRAGDAVQVTYYESVVARLDDPRAACAQREQAYLARLAGDPMPSSQKNEYRGTITGGFQGCMAGRSDPWKEIRNKLPLSAAQQQGLSQPRADGDAVTTVLVTPTPESEEPLTFLGANMVDMVVEVVSYDTSTNIVTVRTSDGVISSFRVDPAMHEFAAARRPGDRVAIEATNAAAISIVKAGG